MSDHADRRDGDVDNSLRDSPIRRGRRGVRGLPRRVLAASLILPLATGLLATPAAHAQDATRTQSPTQTTEATESAEATATTEATGEADSSEGKGPSSALLSPSPRQGDEKSVRETTQELSGLPDGVSVEKVEWITDRHVKVFINSAAMPDAPVAVELLLPRDWDRVPDRTYPTIWHLDGMRATDEASGWSLETNIEDFYSDKNVLVVMPVGGESSFYSDWDEADNGVHYMWETFLMDEMIPVLKEGWRAGDERAVIGLSMGGTSAMNLAQAHPDDFDFVGSLSGYLDTTSTGMPQAIAAAMREAGGYDAAKMWGPLGSERWEQNDPKRHMDRLQGISVYISAGSGSAGEYDIADAQNPNLPDNKAGWGLELLSRMTTETFSQQASRSDLPVTVKLRESGTHSWPYWQFEMTQAWPQLADALELPEEDRVLNCSVGGAIAEKLNVIQGVGGCLTEEIEIDGGIIQDFTNGRAYWSEASGANLLWGNIGGRYEQIGGPTHPLGFPITSERATPGDTGRFVHFENGSIYWSEDTDAKVVRGDVFNVWGDSGWEAGPLGFPTTDRYDVDGGIMQNFQNGVIVRQGEGDDSASFIVLGDIAALYLDSDGPDGPLGMPLEPEVTLDDGGVMQRFAGGSVYWSEDTGAHVVPEGAIMDHWGEAGWENGEFGLPTGPQEQIPAGGREQEFQGGWIREINGTIEEEVR